MKTDVQLIFWHRYLGIGNRLIDQYFDERKSCYFKHFVSFLIFSCLLFLASLLFVFFFFFFFFFSFVFFIVGVEH